MQSHRVTSLSGEFGAESVAAPFPCTHYGGLGVGDVLDAWRNACSLRAWVSRNSARATFEALGIAYNSDRPKQ